MVAKLGGRLWMRRQKFFYVVLGDFFELIVHQIRLCVKVDIDKKSALTRMLFILLWD